MSMEAYLFVADKQCDGPLEKLILTHFASELSGTDGIGHIDIGQLSRFCCAPREDVVSALNSLRQWGHMHGTVGGHWSIVGFQHVRPTPAPTTRKPIKASLRATVWARDNLTCLECGAMEGLTIDHIVPVSAGGGNEIDNLQTLCMPCNIKKGVKQ